MKHSFSISNPKSKPKPKPKPNASQIAAAADEEEQRHQSDNAQSKEYVTVFDPSKTLTLNRSTPHVIPPIQNEWRPPKRMKNLDLPLQSDAADGALRFETETLSSVADADKMSYGLNLRQTAAAANGDAKPPSPPASARESGGDVMLEKLRYDLERLPEDRGFDEFKDVPVEGFGAALLAGYGWREGRGIGKNAKEDVKIKEYHKRSNKEGLGFLSQNSSKAPKSSSNDNISNDDRASTRISSSSTNGFRDGSDRDSKRSDKEKIRDGFFVGKDVRVIAGARDAMGLKGRIVERLDRDRIVLKLAKTEEELRLRVSDIAEFGSKEEEKCLRRLKDLKVGQAEQSSDYMDVDKGVSESRETAKRDSGKVKVDRRRWLTSHIRVRVISKDLKGGRLYLKKGEVVDVVGPYICDISIDESKELVQGVDQDLLETALPRRGGPVLVLYGKHKGVYGNLVERDLDREVGVVRDSDTHELYNVKLEQIAEYIGDPSYIGY